VRILAAGPATSDTTPIAKRLCIPIPKYISVAPPEDTQHDQSVTAPLLFLTIAAVIPAGSVTPELDELRQSKPPATRVLVSHGDAAMMITLPFLSRTSTAGRPRSRSCFTPKGS
jgi:hypothetical protein